MSLESGLKVKITRKIEEIPRQDWGSVFPPVLENYDFFKSLDESNFEQFSFYYIIIYDNGLSVGATTCFTMRFAIDMAVSGPLKFIFNSIKKIMPNILSPKVLMCGLPMGQGRIGIKGDSRRVMQEIYNCMQELAAKEKASMLIFKDFTSAYNDVLGPFLKKGFSRVESLPSTEMDINFGSFEDYLKTLSRSSRDGLKRNFKKVDNKAKINFEAKDILDDGELAQIYELYLQTYEKLDIGLEKLPVDFFKNVCRNMPGNVKFFLWRAEGKLAAFAFCLFSGDYFIDYYLGFDYSLAHDYYLYFIRFRDLLKWCITHGIKKYEMGQTVYEAKRRLGFNFIRLYFYMKHRNPFLNPLFGIVSPLFKPANFDPVFKEMKNKNL